MFLTPDLKLIHAVIQAGLEGYFTARRIGVTAEILYDEARPIWKLMEEMLRTGRLPSCSEITLKTGVEIGEICPEPIDVELAAGFIVKRGLTGQLYEKLQPIIREDGINQDPYRARKRLVEIYHETAWGLGKPDSINSRSAVESLREAYTKAASRGGSLLGLSSPWPTNDAASLGLQPGELTVVFAKRKIGKCNASFTLVHDPDTGREVTIEQMVRQGRNNVLTWEKNEPLYVVSPTDYMDVGEKECLRLSFKSGRVMVVGREHPMLTTNGWRHAESLRVGTHVATAAVIPEPTRRWALPAAEIEMLAFAIADGGLINATPTYTKHASALAHAVAVAAHSIGSELRPTSELHTYTIVGNGLSGGNPVTELLREHGVMGKKSIHKTIPDAIFSLPNEQLALFFGRLFSGDGSVEKKGNSRMVSYSTGSRKMAEQIQHLLLRFGVQMRLYPKPREVTDTETGEKVWRDYWELLIRQETIERFKSTVGQHVIGPKKALLDEAKFQGKSRVGWLKNEELWDEIRAEMEARPELVKVLGDHLGYTTFRFQESHVLDYKSGRIRHKTFEAFCEVYDSPLKWILDENIWWDELVSIENAGKHHCYDLSVPETECYVANDFIVHNSWIVIVWTVHMWKRDLKPGEKILFVTMEMTTQQVMRRMACVDLKVPWNTFREGRLDLHQKKLFDEWCDQRIANAYDPTKADIVFATSKQCRTAADIGALVAEIKPKCVVVDSFYILGRGDGKSIYEKVLGNVEALKLDVALQYDVPVLASTQLKGTVGKDTLQADSDDAMGAKAIGDYADVTRGLFADEELWERQERLFRGMEAREFKPRDIHMHFNFDRMDFSEIAEITGQDFNKEKKKDDGESGFKKRPPKPSAKQIQAAAVNLSPDAEDQAGEELTI